eukprot:PhM_4_TR827/c0_g1_i1/m.4833
MPRGGARLQVARDASHGLLVDNEKLQKHLDGLGREHGDHWSCHFHVPMVGRGLLATAAFVVDENQRPVGVVLNVHRLECARGAEYTRRHAVARQQPGRREPHQGHTAEAPELSVAVLGEAREAQNVCGTTFNSAIVCPQEPVILDQGPHGVPCVNVGMIEQLAGRQIFDFTGHLALGGVVRLVVNRREMMFTLVVVGPLPLIVRVHVRTQSFVLSAARRKRRRRLTGIGVLLHQHLRGGHNVAHGGLGLLHRGHAAAVDLLTGVRRHSGSVPDPVKVVVRVVRREEVALFEVLIGDVTLTSAETNGSTHRKPCSEARQLYKVPRKVSLK